MSGRSGREGVKAVSVCDGSGRDGVSVQEGPSGGRDASGSGPRRRGRHPCRRPRNQAGQFISVVTLFEVMARRSSSILVLTTAGRDARAGPPLSTGKTVTPVGGGAQRWGHGPGVPAPGSRPALLVAMKLLTALASVNQGICTGRRTAQRLYEIESITKLKGRHKYYMELLDQRRHQFQNKPMAIDNIICALFKRTFVPRYRDISSDIRVICMGELGCWIRLYPDMFLDNNYLKYIGWMLYDKGLHLGP
ncbi:uncharacterized protein LOC115937650 [Leptonychotes weddellii]|uniref:Uncharacterized protein LOC115937650 n=1 Tax=Leptonychotes weddellii TaxID=9713 RepID=A0A7F8Q5X1_LEPWE|nr:uncharacterized protein LOC115937650 [Leptonychotes weddellii]